MGERRRGSSFIACAVGFAVLALGAHDVHADESSRYPFTPVEVELYAHAIFPTFETSLTRHYADGLDVGYLGGIGAGLRATFQPFSRGLLGDADDRIGFFSGIGYADVLADSEGSPVTATDATGPRYQDEGELDSVLFPFGLRWLLPLSAHFALFIEPGALVFVRLHALPLNPTDRAMGISPTVAFGLQAPIGRHFAFTLRTGYPMLLTLGASWLP
jgi:hypothetical protein